MVRAWRSRLRFSRSYRALAALRPLLRSEWRAGMIHTRKVRGARWRSWNSARQSSSKRWSLPATQATSMFFTQRSQWLWVASGCFWLSRPKGLLCACIARWSLHYTKLAVAVGRQRVAGGCICCCTLPCGAAISGMLNRRLCHARDYVLCHDRRPQPCHI